MKTANRNRTLRAVGTAVAVAAGLTAATAWAGEGKMDASLGAQIHAQTAHAAVSINGDARRSLALSTLNGPEMPHAYELTPQVDVDALAGNIIRQGATAAADIRMGMRVDLHAGAPYRGHLDDVVVIAEPSVAQTDSLLEALDEQAFLPLRRAMDALDPDSSLDTATITAIARTLASSQLGR